MKRVLRLALAGLAGAACAAAAAPAFHDAPADAAQRASPVAGQRSAVLAGRRLYLADCAGCHGGKGEGGGNVPALAGGAAQTASDGALFWFISRGDADAGMPAWAQLAEAQRWQLVAYVKSLDGTPKTAQADGRETAAAKTLQAPPAAAPFGDFRNEAPGSTHHIAVTDLPPPFATQPAGNSASLVPRPADAWPRVPPGFAVQLYAGGLQGPRALRSAPNGDLFVAESEAGNIRILRGLRADGSAEQAAVFASGLDKPYGMAFYPAGGDPQWLYVADTDRLLRFAYRSGDLQARAAPQVLAALPNSSGGHWTRAIDFSADGRTLYVAVGSYSNASDPDATPQERGRAVILAFNPDGSGRRVYASGIRNAAGLAVHPRTGELWCSVNERDGLGDDLVPDYITHVQPGGFYGWPWWYAGAHQDPRHAGRHAELAAKTLLPDVLLQPHDASLQLVFYDGRQFPAEYRGDLFAAEHGSWNRSVRTGYEVIRVPLHGSGRAGGEYQDFLTGFVLPNGEVWGRPVGVAVAADGALLVSDDGSGSVWRVSYSGP